MATERDIPGPVVVKDVFKQVGHSLAGWAAGVVSELEAKRAGLADKADHKVYIGLIGLPGQI